MGEHELISELEQLNGIIKIYTENILDYIERVGEITEYKVLITEHMNNVLKSRVVELKRQRDKIEYDQLCVPVKVYA